MRSLELPVYLYLNNLFNSSFLFLVLFCAILTISQKFNSCVTYRPTYIQTDTPFYRDARMHLKIAQGKFQLQAGDWPPKRYPSGLLMTSWKCFASQWHHIYRSWWTPIMGSQIIWNISIPSWIFFYQWTAIMSKFQFKYCQDIRVENSQQNIQKILGHSLIPLLVRSHC